MVNKHWIGIASTIHFMCNYIYVYMSNDNKRSSLTATYRLWHRKWMDLMHSFSAFNSSTCVSCSIWQGLKKYSPYTFIEHQNHATFLNEIFSWFNFKNQRISELFLPSPNQLTNDRKFYHFEPKPNEIFKAFEWCVWCALIIYQHHFNHIHIERHFPYVSKCFRSCLPIAT